MDPGQLKTFSRHLATGSGGVAAGSAAGLWLPPDVALVILAGMVCRIGWIEDRVLDALAPSGAAPPDGTAETGPAARLASERRLTAHAWSALAWAVAGGFALTGNVAFTLGAGAAALVLALGHADRRAQCAAHLASGAPLPRHLIRAQGGLLAQLAMIPRRND